MYITIKSIKKTLGKYIEMTDLYIGLPMLITFLTLFTFSNMRIIALIFLTICIFALLPVQVSKKNRMYKVIGLIFLYLLKCKRYVYFKKNDIILLNI